MRRAGSSRALTLDPLARVVATADRLHVMQRQGLFEMRGRGLERLHTRMAPLLDGRWTRDELLASAGEHAPALDRYLRGLLESGALREGKPPLALPDGFPSPRSGLQVLRAARTRVAVTLSGPEAAASGALRLSFAGRAEIEQRLLRLDGLESAAGRIWVVCDRDPDAEELARRAAVARHLLALELARAHERRLSVLELAHDRFSLRRLAVIAPPRTTLASLLRQLELVRLLDGPQLPLVTMAAEMPGLGRRTVGYGCDAAEVSAWLIDACIGRAALSEAIETEGVAGTCGDLDHREAARAAIELTRAHAARAVVASSRARCVEAIIGAWALARSGRGGGRPIDLLAVGALSVRVSVLQEALRRRRRSLPALVDDRWSPLIVLHGSAGRVARLGFEEAVAESLLRAAASDGGLDHAEAVACAPAGCPAALRRRLRRVYRRLGEPVHLITGHIRRLGLGFAFGVLASDLEPDA